MKDKILALIEKLENNYDFESEWYLTYTGQINDGDISDWHENHFDDNIERGVETGQTMLAEEIIGELKSLLESCDEHS